MFTFKYEDSETYGNGANPVKVEMTFDSDITWPEAMDGFVQFLRGAGYFLPEIVTPTLITEEGYDLREKQEQFWDDWADGEEEASK